MRAIYIANYFLNKKDHDISNLKLQKLVYIAFGWYSTFKEDDLFDDEIQAWDYGPVIADLYHKFSDNENNIINPVDLDIKDIFKDDDFKTRFLDIIYDEYSKLSPFSLVTLTHEEGTPWFSHYKKGEKLIISKKSIKNYYRMLDERRQRK